MSFCDRLKGLFLPELPPRQISVIKNDFHRNHRIGPLPIDNDEVATIKSRMLIAEAERWLNVREKGKNKGPEVEMFQRAVDGKASGEAWCAAFVCFCVQQVDRIYDAVYGTAKSLPAQIYMTEHCLTMWNKTPEIARIDLSLHPGLICIWQHYKEGQGTAAGHMGIVKDPLDGDQFISIEGNTENHNSVSREGDGVYTMRRRISHKGKLRIKGFLNPWNGQYIESFQ